MKAINVTELKAHLGNGRLRPGSQQWGKLRISRLEGRVDVQASLRAVREDPSDVRRR